MARLIRKYDKLLDAIDEITLLIIHLSKRTENREYTEELALLEKLLFAAHKNGFKGMAVVERCLEEVRKGGAINV